MNTIYIKPTVLYVLFAMFSHPFSLQFCQQLLFNKRLVNIKRNVFAVFGAVMHLVTYSYIKKY